MMASKDKRTGWLAKLKVGDEVAIYNGYIGFCTSGYDIRTVAAISPTGRLTVNGDVYSHDGYRMGKQYSTWSGRKKLVEPTKSIRDTVERADLMLKCHNAFCGAPASVRDRMSLETLRTVWKAICPAVRGDKE